jgi:hypothetical protein
VNPVVGTAAAHDGSSRTASTRIPSAGDAVTTRGDALSATGAVCARPMVDIISASVAAAAELRKMLDTG